MENKNLTIDGENIVTREFWLLQAAKRMPKIFFDDSAQLPDGLQVAVGYVKGNQEKVLGVCTRPTDKNPEDFPPTIVLNHNIDDTEKLLEVLVHECIHSFGINGHGKAFGKYAEIAGFAKPYKFHNPTEILKDRVHQLNMDLTAEFGPYPGEAVKGKEKEPKERKQNILTMNCPLCEYKVKVHRKLVEEYGAPICPVHGESMVDTTNE